MSLVIGISAYYHDSTVALVKDGRLVDFVKEEWLTRVKGDHAFPTRSIRLLKTRWGLDDSAIEEVVFYERPLSSWLSLLSWCAKSPVERWRLGYNKLSNFFSSGVFFEAEIKRYFPSAKVMYADHHRSHAMNAKCYAQNPDDCLIIVLDSFGDGASGGVYDSDLNTIKSFKFPHSLGLFYSAITEYCGFLANEGEAKTMGLAGLGQPKYLKTLREFLKVSDGVLSANLKFFSYQNDPSKYLSDLGEGLLPNLGTNPLGSECFQVTADLAASMQQFLEESLIALVLYYLKKFPVSEIVLSGGVALNVAAITRLATEFENVTFTVPISPGDSGSAIGAAFQATPPSPLLPENQRLFPGVRVLDFSNSKFQNLIRKIAPSDLAVRSCCDLLLEGSPVALMANQVELGPRALGATSILFHSHNGNARQIFNDSVKGRESYRPLAPVVLERNFSRFFEASPNIRHLLRYMGALAKQTDHLKLQYPGYAHADGTCRVQIIDEEAGLLFGVMSELERHGEFVLINTSLNVGGDPMVYDEVDLITSLRRMNMKYVLCEDGLYALFE